MERELRHTFIAIEGTDGSGKKTQIAKLCAFLKKQGKSLLKISFPNYQSLSSGPVRMYLGGEFGDDPTTFNAYQGSVLYAVDRMCTMKKVLSGLEKDTIIIFDRYAQSNMMHQAGKIKDKAEVGKYLEWVQDFEFNLLGIPKVDKVFFLDVPVAISTAAAQARTKMKIGKKYSYDIHEQNNSHLEDAYNTGVYVANKLGWTTIDCATKDGKLKSIEKIHEMIKAEVLKVYLKEGEE